MGSLAACDERRNSGATRIAPCSVKNDQGSTGVAAAGLLTICLPSSMPIARLASVARSGSTGAAQSVSRTERDARADLSPGSARARGGRR